MYKHAVFYTQRNRQKHSQRKLKNDCNINILAYLIVESFSFVGVILGSQNIIARGDIFSLVAS